MKIALLNGNPDEKNHAFEAYLTGLSEQLNQNHEVNRIQLRDKKISYCIGCWSCWVKTPGTCFAKDDSHEVCKAVIQSDLVLFASPVIMGFTSALLKKTQDKLIPLVHPYIEMVGNESHHRKRYEQYPRLGLLVERSSDTDDEDLDIIEEMYKRLSLNLKSKWAFCRTTEQPIQEVADEINNF